MTVARSGQQGGVPAHPTARVVGRYAICGEIASGGMATVYCGRSLGASGVSRTVAIKQLHPQYAKDPEFVAMFRDEARLATRINHPNVVATLDVLANNGEILLVMEYVQGETLAGLMRTVRERGERIPAGVAVAIVAQVLHGLHAAHEAQDEHGAPLGIVHRDVSPQNVIVGIDGIARVLDFGIAKAANRLQTTRDGQLKGKLAYMAPEQITGKVDRHTDVYAAGVLLWEALTGRRLFQAENQGQLLHLVLGGKRERPAEHVKELHPVLDEITVRALQFDPGQRFPTARDMAAALERSGEVATVSTVGEWVQQAARTELSRRTEMLREMENSAKMRIQAPPTSGEDPTTRMASPVRAPSAAPPAPSRPKPSATGNTPARRHTSKRRVLVIDASEETLVRIRRALESDGYEVVTTTRTVGNARHIPTCDLVIIGYDVPGIDGEAIVRSLRNVRGEHDCLFYARTVDPKIAGHCQKIGFDGTISDRGDDESFVSQVRAAMRVLQVRAMQRKPPRSDP
jgi:serine/threonine protein kinase